ncbi:unnamed protein product [Cuscuta campestris]|uniref:PH domain-containing protein n=1 Tax=Cuscuta campestris TaxID=132261 RepID=A0A484N8J1_9ASTE|nr:unnamed protein product [Cuscuta campestris]
MEISAPQSDCSRMDGWLYLVRSNSIGLQYSRKRYFVLQDHLLNSYKSIPDSKNEDPVRSAVIDSCIRVTDNGRENIKRRDIFVFSLYNTSNHNDQLKLGATSPEEAARWIQAIQEAALKAETNRGNALDFPVHDSQSLRSRRQTSVDWTYFSSSTTDARSDVVASSSWTIFGCKNGLRLFKETKDRESQKRWDDNPAIMAVGVVDGTSEAIFQTLMSLGPSRSE